MASHSSKDMPLPVPVELEDYAPGIALDIGGSITKLLYRSKEKLPPVAGMSQRIRIAYLPRDDTDNLAAYVREHCDVPEHNDPIPITTTGVGGTQYHDQINEKLNVKASNASEMDCFVRGIRCLSKYLDDDQFYYPLPPEALDDALPVARGFLPLMLAMGVGGKEQQDIGAVRVPEDMLRALEPEHVMATYGADTPRMPCALAMCGSGCAIINLTDTEGGEFGVLGYTPGAGRQLMGLGRLLTGAKSYGELLALAERGDSSQVNTHNRDLRGAALDDIYTAFPDETLTFFYGKAMDKDLSSFKKEDLAAAVVLNSIASMLQIVLSECRQNDVTNVLLCGAMMDHPYARRCLMYQALVSELIEMRPGKKITVRMARYGTYIGVLGAWLIGMEQAQKQAGEQAQKQAGEQAQEQAEEQAQKLAEKQEIAQKPVDAKIESENNNNR